MEPINVQEALQRDPKFQDGIAKYKEMDAKAGAVAEEITSKLIDAIVKKEESFNISTALLSVSKALTHLTSYLYDSEDEFLTDVKKARTAIVTDVVPALLNPQPCGLCEACKNGRPYECENPAVRGDYTATRFLPLVCNMLIEYDLFNKILHMYTAEDSEQSSDAAPGNSSDVASGKESEVEKNGSNAAK